MVTAALLGGAIGLDREYRAKEAGLRTHFLVCLGSALFMIVSQYGFHQILQEKGVGLDPSRIAAQVASGIGFIGAGTIIIQKQFVRGLTTAAGLWATAAIGLVAGAGMYWVAVAGMVLTLVGLELTSLLLKRVGLHSTLLVFTTSRKENLSIITNEINRRGHTISSYTTEEQNFGDTRTYHVSVIIKVRKFGEESSLFQFIQDLPDITVERME